MMPLPHSQLAVALTALWPILMLTLLSHRSPISMAQSTPGGGFPQGAHPDLASFYKPSASGDFHCVDGSAKIPWDQVNDDYCDCKDGSDEPGTSACTNGKFYCPNAGHQPRLLQSSRVNDGICDCCDGSDEWGRGEEAQCVNECAVLGEAARLEAEKLAEVHKAGWTKRQERAKQGQERRQREKTELEELNKGLEEAKAKRDERQAAKEEKEEIERAALDVHNEKVERLREEREALERIEDEKVAREYFQRLDTNGNQVLEQSEMMADVPTFDADANGEVSEAELAMFMPEVGETLSVDEFLNDKWKLIKPLLTASQEHGGTQEQQPEEIGQERVEQPQDATEDADDPDSLDSLGDIDHEDPDADLDDLDDDYPDYDEDDEEEEGKPRMRKYRDNRLKSRRDSGVPNVDRSDYDEGTRLAVEAADAARTSYDEADREVRDAEDKIQALEKTLAQDFGTDSEYASLRGECFEVSDLEYTYKLCPFDYAEQKPKHGGAGTRLGSWDSWIMEGENRVGMKYANGVTCWNGPARSTKVVLSCGAEDRLLSASEPGRCEYQFEFETPSFCKEDPAQMGGAALPYQRDEL